MLKALYSPEVTQAGAPKVLEITKLHKTDRGFVGMTELRSAQGVRYELFVVQSTPSQEEVKVLARFNGWADHVGGMAEQFPAGRGVRLDLAPFQISAESRAIGVRSRFADFGQKEGWGYEYLQLFQFQDGKLKRIFRDVVLEVGYRAGQKNCVNEYTIHVDTRKTNGFSGLDRRRKSQGCDSDDRVSERPAKVHYQWDLKQGRYEPFETEGDY